MESSNKLKMRRLVLLSGLGIFLLFIAYFIFNYSLVSVSVTADNPSQLKSTEVSLIDGDSKVKMQVGAKKYIVLNRAEHYITVTNEREETSIKVSPNFFYDSLDLKLEPQALITKVAGESQGCAVKGVQTYSWQCEGRPAEIFVHTYNPPYPSKKPSGLPLVYNPISYKSGLVGFVEPDQGSSLALTYLNLSASPITSTNLGQGLDINTDNLDSTLILVDSGNDSSLAVLNLSARWFYFYKERVGVSTKFKLPSNPNNEKGSAVAFNLSGDNLYYYAGNSDEDLDTHVEESDAKNSEPTLWRINAISGSSQELNIPGSLALSSFAVSGSYLYAKTNSSVDVYKINGTTLTQTDSVPFTANAEVSVKETMGSIYLARDSSLYEYSPINRSMRLLFRTDNYTISDMDGTSFSAFLDGPGTSQVLNAFVFDSQKTPSYPRLEDALPLADADNKIRKIDYVDNTIYIQISLLSYIQEKRLGRVVINENEYQDAKDNITNLLKEKGLDTNKLSIVFSY